MCLGIWHDRDKRLLQFCGGLFYVNEEGDGVKCKKCSTFADKIEFICAFCNRATIIGVQERVAQPTGRSTVIKMPVHQTVVFSIGST